MENNELNNDLENNQDSIEKQNNVELLESTDNDFKDKKKSKAKIIIIVLVVILILGVGGYFGYKYYESMRLNNNSNSNNNETKEIDADTKKKILNIIGLTENGISERDSFNPYSLQLFLASLSDNKELILDNISNESKKRLVYLYAVENKLLKTINGSEYEYCYAGSDECQAITSEDYAAITKKYGITTLGNELYSREEQYKNYYLYKDGGTVAPPGTIKDSYEIVKDNNDIIVKYNYSFKLDGEPDKYYGDTEIKAIYTFKQDNNEYYLYKINSDMKIYVNDQSNQNTDVSNNQTNEALNINSSLVQDLYNKVKDFYRLGNTFKDYTADDRENNRNFVLKVEDIPYDTKFDMVYNNIIKNKGESFKCNDYINEIFESLKANPNEGIDIYCGPARYYYNENARKFEGEAVTEFYSEELIKQGMKSLFGKEYYDTKSVVDFDFVYIPSKKGYAFVINGTVGGYSYNKVDKLISAEKKDNNLILTEQTMHTEYMLDSTEVEREFNYIYTFKYNELDDAYYLSSIERKFIK